MTVGSFFNEKLKISIQNLDVSECLMKALYYSSIFHGRKLSWKTAHIAEKLKLRLYIVRGSMSVGRYQRRKWGVG